MICPTAKAENFLRRGWTACKSERMFEEVHLSAPTAIGYYMQNEWSKPREYSFISATGEVFHEIAYSRQDVNTFAKMHKATSFKPTEAKGSLDGENQNLPHRL